MAMESVWDYPRPPRLEPTVKRLTVELDGVVVAETTRAHRVLETSHPPIYYIPPDDILDGALQRSGGRGSMCVWKGAATYYDVVVGDKRVERAAWTYLSPTLAFAAIRDAVAFYPELMDGCTVDGEVVAPQPGSFYGGWITSDLVGPSKGEPGTAGW